MRKFGLIGKQLAHSFSPTYFAEKFYNEQIDDAIYALFPIEKASDVLSLLKSYPEIRGLNVTIPFKENIIPFLDDIDPDAKYIGAVNCIDIRDGKTKGYNTDWTAFRESIKPRITNFPSKALVLGNGGASKAVVYALKNLGLDCQVVSRRKSTGVILYKELNEDIYDQYKIIVNTTPLGMVPNISKSPQIDYSLLNNSHLVYDLIYNPTLTLFLRQAHQRGASIVNGIEMLHLQAEQSWTIWNNP